MDLKSTWDCLVPEFHSWFVKYEADLFKTNLIKEVTNLAQIDGHFSNNRTESVNNNVKDWLGRSGSVSLAVVNRKIEEYVKAQQQEMEMTIYSNGPYELAQSHQYLRKDRHIWNAMSTDERRDSLQEFWSSSLVKTCKKSTVIEPKRSDIHETTVQSDSTKLSITLDNFGVSSVSVEMLREMWDRADSLLSRPGTIVNAPSYNALMVQHAVGEKNNPPHLITSTKTGKYVCDCHLYKSFKMCGHTLAAADFQGKLGSFLQWRRTDKTTVNLTDLVMGNISSGKKPKVSKPRKEGGGQPH